MGQLQTVTFGLIDHQSKDIKSSLWVANGCHVSAQTTCEDGILTSFVHVQPSLHEQSLSRQANHGRWSS